MQRVSRPNRLRGKGYCVTSSVRPLGREVKESSSPKVSNSNHHGANAGNIRDVSNHFIASVFLWTYYERVRPT